MLSELPFSQQVLVAANSFNGKIFSMQGLDQDPHWSHQCALVAMVDHHGITSEGKSKSISYIEFIITNAIFILRVLTGNLTVKHPAVPRAYLHSQGFAKTSIMQEANTKIRCNGYACYLGISTLFN